MIEKLLEVLLPWSFYHIDWSSIGGFFVGIVWFLCSLGAMFILLEKFIIGRGALVRMPIIGDAQYICAVICLNFWNEAW